MTSLRAFFLWNLVLFLTSCGNRHDLFQEKVNEEAFQRRFQREAIADEETGVILLPRLPGEGSLSSLDLLDLKWKSVFMTGDDSISAFDNARIKLHSLFLDFGTRLSIQLSRSSLFHGKEVRPASIANLEQAVRDLNVDEGNACLIHMTSHGTKTGFYIKGQDYLTPRKLNQIVTNECGNQPTVLLISACYSGVFAEPEMQANNRIILTAARKDKTSFGCSSEAQYTYWDGCLIDSLQTSITWVDVARQLERCIERKEAAGGFARSYPQARIGADMQAMPIRQ